MALETFVAGRYTGTWNAVDMGLQENGFMLSGQSSEELIAKSDAYGDTVLDTIYRGANWFMEFTALGYKAGTIAPLWPFATFGSLGLVGRLGSSLAQSLVLTSTAGTPAATSPTTLTATLAKLAEGFDARLMFDSSLRKVPMRMRMLPADVMQFHFRLEK